MPLEVSIPREMPLAFLRDLHLTHQQSNTAIPKPTSLGSTMGLPNPPFSRNHIPGNPTMDLGTLAVVLLDIQELLTHTSNNLHSSPMVSPTAVALTLASSNPNSRLRRIQDIPLPRPVVQ
jgi:hypothetical protein